MRQYWKLLMTFIAGLLFLTGVNTVSAQTDSPADAEWYARYWNNMEQEGDPVLERNERTVDYDWGLGSPSSAVNADGFSARWTSPVMFEEGMYRFTLTSDDGARLWLDNEYIIERWHQRPATTDEVDVYLEEGVHYLAVDYFEDGGYAMITLDWQRVGDDDETSGESPSVTIDPLSGPVGSEIAVRATGFSPGNTVSVGIGRANSETTTSFQAEIPADGVLETSITVPQSADPGEPWRVLILGDEARALSDDFIVTATSGEVAPCGSIYIVQPNDWLAKIARNCNTTILEILALNPGIEDPNRISVGTVLNMPAEGEMTPRATITPHSGSVGTDIQVTGVGFAENVDVSVALRRPGELPITGQSVTTDNDGQLQATVQLPSAAEPGDIWHVLLRSGEQHAESEPFVVTWGDETIATPRYNLNLRSGPGIAFEDLDTVPAGSAVPVFETSPDGNWVRVLYDGTEGWIAAWLSDLSSSLESSIE